jgi:hypothetical protein
VSSSGYVQSFDLTLSFARSLTAYAAAGTDIDLVLQKTSGVR